MLIKAAGPLTNRSFIVNIKVDQCFDHWVVTIPLQKKVKSNWEIVMSGYVVEYIQFLLYLKFQRDHRAEKNNVFASRYEPVTINYWSEDKTMNLKMVCRWIHLSITRLIITSLFYGFNEYSIVVDHSKKRYPATLHRWQHPLSENQTSGPFLPVTSHFILPHHYLMPMKMALGLFFPCSPSVVNDAKNGTKMMTACHGEFHSWQGWKKTSSPTSSTNVPFSKLDKYISLYTLSL